MAEFIYFTGKKIAKDVLKQMEDKKLDLILSPVFPVPAVRVDDPANLFRTFFLNSSHS